MSVISAPNNDAPGIGDNSGLTEEELATWADEEGEGQGDEDVGEPEDAYEGDDAGENGEGDGEQGEQQQGAGADRPPEFWSAEKKALWSRIQDPEVRAAIHDHVKQASAAVSSKMEEAAKARQAAEEAATAATANQEQLANWWKANGQRIQLAVLGKWAGVDWQKLSTEDPARYVQLKQQYEGEQQFIVEATQRHQAEVQKAAQRQELAHQRERAAEHAKLAEKFPAEFGPEKAADTYGVLSDYLLKQGIAGDRLKGIYEAPVVEIVRKAYKYDQLQAKAKGITNPKPPGQSASTTPRRFVPGPGNAGNRQNAAQRQAFQRLSNSQTLSDDDVTELFG